MIDEVIAGAKVKLREKISDSVPVGSIATVLYIDDLDNVFIEWVSNGRLTSFSKKNFLYRTSNFKKHIDKSRSVCYNIENHQYEVSKWN